MLSPEFSDDSSPSYDPSAEHALLLDKYTECATEFRQEVLQTIHRFTVSQEIMEWALFCVDPPYIEDDSNLIRSPRNILLISHRRPFFELPIIRIITNEVFAYLEPNPEDPEESLVTSQIMSEDFALSSRNIAHYGIDAAGSVPGSHENNGTVVFKLDTGEIPQLSSNVRGLPYIDRLLVDETTELTPFASNTLAERLAALEIGKTIFAETLGLPAEKYS